MAGREDKKQRILDAALPLFAEKGFEKTTIDEIARFADISKGTVYTYFKSKEDLFDQLVKFWLTKLKATLKRSTKTYHYEKKIHALIVLFIDFFRNNPSSFWIMEEYKLHSRKFISLIDEPISEHFFMDADVLEMIQKEVQAGNLVNVSAENQIFFVLSSLLNMLYKEFVGKSRITVRDMDEIEILIKHGLFPEKRS